MSPTDTARDPSDPGPVPAGLVRKPATQAIAAAVAARAVKASEPKSAPVVAAEPAPKAKPAKAAKPASEPKVKAAKPAKATKPTKNAEPASPPVIRRSIVPLRFKQQYAQHNDTNGDRVATVLKQATTTVNADGRECLDLAALTAIAAANGIDVAKYASLNNGQKRMNVGNRMRGMLKNGQKVVIGKQTFANAEKALAKPEPKAEQAAA